MADRKSIIRKLSDDIASRYAMYKWIDVACAVISLAILILMQLSPVAHSFFAGIFTLSFIYLIYLFDHQGNMLYFLKGENETAFSQLETYLEKNQHQWVKYYWWRVIGVATFGLIMLFTLIFFKNSPWTPRIAGLFPVILLALIIRGWCQFNDQILLHDVIRNKNDQISEP